MTSLKINRLLPMATINMHMKFEIEILKRTWLMLRKPCHLQTDGRTEGRTDRRTDGRTDKVNPVYPPSNFVGQGYNYKSRQVHKTLNGLNPSHIFRDTSSAKTAPNLCQIWQVFGPWASPYGSNGQMTITVHNCRPRQFHRTSNHENPSSGYRYGFRKSGTRPPELWQYPSSPEGWGVKRGFDQQHTT